MQRDLNSPNRPVRTRMPGGVGGVPEENARGPYPDFPLFRRVLRVGRERALVDRARCSEHEIVGDVPIAVAEIRVWGSEPGRALRVAFNSAWL